MIRTAVFIVEQQVPVELEWDDMDPLSLHAMAYDDQGTPVGTGRLLPDGHIGRMAVLTPYRNLGVGSAILQTLISHALQRGDSHVVLHAQRQAENFYRRHGFVAEGEEFEEAGIPHVLMRRTFIAA